MAMGPKIKHKNWMIREKEKPNNERKGEYKLEG
jgi:hypothetical protein